MNIQTLKLMAVFICSVILCYAAFRMGNYVVVNSRDRSPAAIPKIYDYSHLEGAALTQAAQDRLISGAKIVTAGSASGLQLGHFVTKNAEGAPAGACEVYSQVELVFYAGGMAVSGDSPRMNVYGPCIPGDDINVIEPIMISADKIFSLPVRDQELSSFSDRAVTVKFVNVSDSWPRIWILQSARLIDERANEIKVSDDDIRRVLGKAPYLDWQ